MLDYIIYLVVLVALYCILSASLDLLVGFTGILTFGHAAFYGIGAYSAAILAKRLGQGFFVGLLAAIAVTAIVAFVVAIPALRLTSHYFVLATYGFSVIVSTVMTNWVGLTNGPSGISGIPEVDVAGVPLGGSFAFLGLTLAAAAIVLFAKWRLASSPAGIALRAVREDPTVAEVLGKDVVRTRVTIFVLAGACTAIAGTLLVYHLRIVNPSLFDISFTIFLLAALFVGGTGTTLGTIIGPAILVLFPEGLRFVGLTGDYVAQVQQALYGLLLVLLMLFRPQGLAGRAGVPEMAD